MYPLKPTLFTDFFASRNAGFTLRCDDLQANEALKVCTALQNLKSRAYPVRMPAGAPITADHGCRRLQC